MIGSEREVKWSPFMEHHLLRNQVYIHYAHPKDWVIEKKTFFKPAVGSTEKYITPDARFTRNGVTHYLEVDRTQSMSQNKLKIEEYKEISPLIEISEGHKPVIVWFTARNSRVDKLKKWCKEAGLNCEVHSFEDLR